MVALLSLFMKPTIYTVLYIFFLFGLQAFAKQFNMAPDDLDMHVIYDVSHNVAKIEEHIVDGKPKTLLVHRKVSF